MKSVKWHTKDIYPSKIVCIGRNYVEHIKEFDNQDSQEAVIFMKPNSAISDDIYTHKTEVIHYEAEIVFLIMAGKLTAVGFGLDLTKRELQYELKKKGYPWERAKSFDKSAVLSNFVTIDSAIRDLRLEFYINETLVQFANYDLMIMKPEQMLKELEGFLTLEDGDLLMTGTPKGVGPVKAGDKYRGKIFAADKLIIDSSWCAK